MAMSGTLILGFPGIQDLVSSEPAKFRRRVSRSAGRISLTPAGRGWPPAARGDGRSWRYHPAVGLEGGALAACLALFGVPGVPGVPRGDAPSAPSGPAGPGLGGTARGG